MIVVVSSVIGLPSGSRIDTSSADSPARAKRIFAGLPATNENVSSGFSERSITPLPGATAGSHSAMMKPRSPYQKRPRLSHLFTPSFGRQLSPRYEMFG